MFNRAGLVWIGRRSDENAEGEGEGKWWQMPQGGLDGEEEPEQAVFRELYEETSMSSLSLLRAAPRWFNYDLPKELIGQSWHGKYRGQTQKWFALRFDGPDTEIDDRAARRRKAQGRVLGLALGAAGAAAGPGDRFKREVYRQVVAAFRDVAAK